VSLIGGAHDKNPPLPDNKAAVNAQSPEGSPVLHASYSTRKSVVIFYVLFLVFPGPIFKVAVDQQRKEFELQ
jgi:hypothetical protein